MLRMHPRRLCAAAVAALMALIAIGGWWIGGYGLTSAVCFVRSTPATCPVGAKHLRNDYSA